MYLPPKDSFQVVHCYNLSPKKGNLNNNGDTLIIPVSSIWDTKTLLR